jgi:hypothetical protein
MADGGINGRTGISAGQSADRRLGRHRLNHRLTAAVQLHAHHSADRRDAAMPGVGGALLAEQADVTLMIAASIARACPSGARSEGEP